MFRAENVMSFPRILNLMRSHLKISRKPFKNLLTLWRHEALRQCDIKKISLRVLFEIFIIRSKNFFLRFYKKIFRPFLTIWKKYFWKKKFLIKFFIKSFGRNFLFSSWIWIFAGSQSYHSRFQIIFNRVII